MEIESGTIVANRYRVLRPLGRGGMGEVFAAENTRTGRVVAIKVLHADAKTKHAAVERFKREARAAGSINSDHVTQVLDVDEDAEHGIILVFELLEGESLIDRLKRTGPIPFDELWTIVEQVWIGLADAHRVGIIHRDLKPSNVFMERRPDGKTRVKLLDFGVSKLPKEMEGETLTEMGQSLGTFSFMPPEQISKAKMVDHRADIYACTTMIYQSLTGQLPYLAKNVLVMVELKAKQEPRTLADAMDGPVDARLEAFVARGLARDADRRFQTATEALAAWRELHPRLLAHEGDNPTSSNPMPGGGARSAPSLPSSGPRGTLSLSAIDRPDLRRSNQSLPVVNEPSTDDDSAATLAMPLGRMLHPNALPGRGQPQAWGPQAPSDPRASSLPTDLRGSTPLQQPQPAMPPASHTGSSTVQMGAHGGYPGASASGGYVAVQPASPSGPGMYGPPSQNPYPDAPPPQSGFDRMQVYAPQGAVPQGTGAVKSAGPWAQPSPPSAGMQEMPAPHAERRWLPLLLGAIAFALIGFVIVGAVLLATNGKP